MSRKIKILVGSLALDADLVDTPNAQMVWDALPISAKANTWGDEVYFTIPVSSKLDKTAKELVDLGDIGYWPTGRALCIFFGPTPLSQGKEIRPASAVNIIGKCNGDPKVLKTAVDGDMVRIERAE